MLRITSLNVNGIRSAFRKGLADWLADARPDIVCLQEIKIQDGDLADDLRHPDGLTGYFHHAEKKGYSGVGLYLRRPADAVTEGMGCPEFDAEGRILRADWPGLTVISAYLPSGSSGDERQTAKYRFLDHFETWMDGLMREHRDTGREFVICGDWNIAHKEIDLKNWKGNLKHSGFLPEERAWLSKIHLVEQPRPGLGQERRLAHRLPHRHPRHRRPRARRLHPPRTEVQRPRATDHRLRLVIKPRPKESTLDVVEESRSVFRRPPHRVKAAFLQEPPCPIPSKAQSPRRPACKTGT